MMKQNQRGRIVLFASIIVSLLICSLAIWDFGKRLHGNLGEHILEHLMDEAIRGQEEINDELGDAFDGLELIAQLLPASGDGEAAVINFLKEQEQNSPISNLLYTTPENLSISSEGKQTNAINIKYFQKVFSGKKGLVKQDGNTELFCAVPVFRNGTVTGIISRTITLAKVRSYKLQTKGEIMLIQKDGTILFSDQEKMNGNNWIDQVRQAELLDRMTENDIRQALENGQGTPLHYQMGKEVYYSYLLPSNIEQGWYLICTIPEAVLTGQYKDITGISILLLIKTGIGVLILVAVVMMMIWRSNKELTKAKKELEMLTANIPGGVFTYTADEKEQLQFISGGLLQMLGYTEAAFREVTKNRFSNMVYWEDRERVLKEIDEQILANGKDDQVEYRVQTADGRLLWVDDRGQYIKDARGNAWFYVIILDISEKKAIQEEIAKKEECFRLILDKSDNIIMELDFQKDIASFSESAEQKLGMSSAVRNYLKDFESTSRIHPEDREKYFCLLQEIRNGLPYGEQLCRIRHLQSGQYVWYRICVMAVKDRDTTVIKAFAIGIDVDQEIKENVNLKQMAQTDSLTGLFNKGITESLIYQFLEGDKDQTHAFIMIDVDNFKYINDTYGHLAGDFVLSELAGRLKQCIEHHISILGRIGGDEFVVFLKNIKSEEQAGNMVEQLLNHIIEPIVFQKQVIVVSASAGISIYDQDGKKFKELYVRADQALYRAKKLGKNRFCFYSDTID